MAKYAVTIRHKVVEVTGPHKDIRLAGGRVRASYRVAGDTYHIVRVSDRHVADDLIANAIINHAQSLGFRGLDVVRLRAGKPRRSKPVSEAQTGLFDIEGDNGDAE